VIEWKGLERLTKVHSEGTNEALVEQEEFEALVENVKLSGMHQVEDWD
jgi:hypothetical protein